MSISLFRSFMKEARKIPDYNFRTYALRRVKAGFEKSRHVEGEEASALRTQGQQQLEVLRRQAALGQMFPSAKSVME